MTYTHWYSGEPNDYTAIFAEGEDYGVLNWHLPQKGWGPVGTWNDTTNGGVNGSTNGPLPVLGIIELTSFPIPEIDPAGMGSILALVTGALGLTERRRLKVSERRR